MNVSKSIYSLSALAFRKNLCWPKNCSGSVNQSGALEQRQPSSSVGRVLH